MCIFLSILEAGMKLLWGQKVTFHRMIPSVPILLLEPSRAVLCGTEFAIRRANSYMSKLLFHLSPEITI